MCNVKELRTGQRGGSSICVTFIARSMILLLTVLGAEDTFAQDRNRDIPVSFTLLEAQPTCAIAKLKDVDFGVIGKQTHEGVAFAQLNHVSEDDELIPIYGGLTYIDGTPSVGKFKVTAGNTNTLTLTFDIPDHLIMGDPESSETKIIYDAQHYGYSRSEDGPWESKVEMVKTFEGEDALSASSPFCNVRSGCSPLTPFRDVFFSISLDVIKIRESVDHIMSIYGGLQLCFAGLGLHMSSSRMVNSLIVAWYK